MGMVILYERVGNMETKICKECGTGKSVEEFLKLKNSIVQ